MIASTLTVLLLVSCIAQSQSESNPKVPSEAKALSIIEIYKQPIPGAPHGDVPFVGAFLVGHDKILLESKDHLLFMCNAKDGSLLWSINLFDLGGDRKDCEYMRRVLRAARYESNGDLGLIISGTLKAEYIRYNRAARKINRYGLALSSGEWKELPRYGNLILLPKGIWMKKAVSVFDLKTHKYVQRLAPPPRKHDFTYLTFSKEGKYVAVAGDSVWVWDLGTGKLLHEDYLPHEEIQNKWKKLGGYSPSCCTFSHDNELLAVGTRGDELLVFEVASAKSLVAVESPAYWGGPMLLSFLGETGFIFGAGHNMYIYDFPNRQWLKIDAFEQDRDLTSVGGVAVDGNSIFVCDYSGNLRRFDWSVAKRNGDVH